MSYRETETLKNWLSSCPVLPVSRSTIRMGTLMAEDSDDTDRIIRQARAGEMGALNELFARHRVRLRRMVQMRLSWRLQGRIDESDVIQDAYLEAARRLEEYLVQPNMPLFLWLRFLVGERLLILHRHHLGTKMRDARREVSIFREALPDASSAALAAQLLGQQTSPSEAACRAERLLRIQEAINRLDPMDREVLSLRHFEQLSRAETAQVLGIAEAAAAKRYIRALKRLKDLLADLPGGLEGM
jgi:RNA polymerase sigma-70 factor, ECF subfamily